MADTAQVRTLVYAQDTWPARCIWMSWLAHTNPPDIVIVGYGRTSWPSYCDRIWYFEQEA